MLRSTRALAGAARCDALAANAAQRLARFPYATAIEAEERRYRETAQQWRRIAAEEATNEDAVRRCWCGRKLSTLPDSDGVHCSEHDHPVTAR